MADEANVVKDEKQEITSVAGSDTKEQSSKEPKLPETIAEFNDAIKKAVSDYASKRGDRTKTLEERVNALETEKKTLVEAQLASTASKYGLTVEQVRSLGIDDPSKIEAVANLFGQTPKQDVVTERVIPPVDSGKSSSIRVLHIPTDSQKLGQWIKDNPEEYRKNRDTVSKMQKDGLIK